MTQWTSRPTEIARLLNPAFCALILRASIRGYCEEDDEGMPFALAFLVLPLALHKRSRTALPKTVGRRLTYWITDEQQLRIGLADRARALVPYTQEALVFALRDPLCIVERARLRPAKRRLKEPWPNATEPRECVAAARTLGRLFARAGDAATVLTNFGLDL